MQVSESFSGLRVLPKSKENANKRSRETIYLCDREHRPRIVSIFGGKLTAYRATAEIALSKIKTGLPLRSAVADTKILVCLVKYLYIAWRSSEECMARNISALYK